MNILYAGNVSLEQETGPSLHFAGLARALHSRGHNVTVMARGDRILDGFRDLDAKLVPFVKTPQVATLLSDIFMFSEIVRHLQLSQFDVLYQRGVPLANRLAHRFRLPSLVEVNSMYADELHLRGVRGFKLKAYQHREKHIVKRASRVVCVTEGIQEQVVRRYSVPTSSCLVIPNAAETSLFRPKPKPECQRRAGLASDRYNIGFVGAFAPWVDFDSLLRAIRLLSERNVPVCCTLVGYGLMRPAIVEQIDRLGLQGQVKLTGPAPYQDIPNWIGAFDVCVAPFTKIRNETIGLSPLKLFEYMACQRPVVAAALPGIVEPVESAGAGLLYPAEEVTALADQLHLLYKDPERRRQLESHGRSYVLEHHSWECVAERLESTMLDLIVGNDSGIES